MDHKLGYIIMRVCTTSEIAVVDNDAQVAHLMVLPLLFLGEQVAILLCILSVPLAFFCWC